MTEITNSPSHIYYRGTRMIWPKLSANTLTQRGSNAKSSRKQLTILSCSFRLSKSTHSFYVSARHPRTCVSLLHLRDSRNEQKSSLKSTLPNNLISLHILVSLPRRHISKVTTVESMVCLFLSSLRSSKSSKFCPVFNFPKQLG